MSNPPPLRLILSHSSAEQSTAPGTPTPAAIAENENSPGRPRRASAQGVAAAVSAVRSPRRNTARGAAPPAPASRPSTPPPTRAGESARPPTTPPPARAAATPREPQPQRVVRLLFFFSRTLALFSFLI